MRFVWAFGALIIAMVGGWIYLIQPFPGSTARDALGDRQTVERDGRTIVYYTQGTGPRVAFAASAGREASDFNELTIALVTAGYRTVAIEAPGINGTRMPREVFNLYDLAADIDAVLKADRAAVGGAATILVGHAFGNRVMRATAHKYPGGIQGVVLIAAGGQKPVPEDAAIALRNCFDPLRTGAQRLEDVRYAFFAMDNGIPRFWLRGWHGNTAILQGKASPATPDDLWQQAGTAPILILQGAQDRIAPKEDAADVLAASLGDRVDVVVLDPAGHAILPEQPDQVADAVIAFVERVVESDD